MEADLNDPITFAREVEGKMTPIGDIVFHSWSDAESVREPPAHFLDVTAETTKRVLGKAAGTWSGSTSSANRTCRRRFTPRMHHYAASRAALCQR